MTNREKLYEIAGRLGADADLAVVRAALLALIRVLLGLNGARPVAHAVGIDAVVAGIVTQQTPRKGTARETPEQRCSAFDDILRQRDDEKTPEDWAASLRKVIDPDHSIVMGEVGAVALRAVESIDRRATPYEKTRSDLAGKGIHMAPIGGWPHQREDEPQEPGK